MCPSQACNINVRQAAAMVNQIEDGGDEDAIISGPSSPPPVPAPALAPLPPLAASHANGAASATVAVAEIEDADDPAATAPLPSVQDYTCAICLELLLRPVVLSCGHHFCRGCWLRMLQHHRNAYLTGSATCPFRCRVRPVVPRVDQALASKLEYLFEVQYTARASAFALPDEERRAAKVNAWAAAGCKPDRVSEYSTLEEVEYARAPSPAPSRSRPQATFDRLPTAPAATVARRRSPRSVLRYGRTLGLARVCGRLRSQISALLRCSSRVSPM